MMRMRILAVLATALVAGGVFALTALPSASGDPEPAAADPSAAFGVLRAADRPAATADVRRAIDDVIRSGPRASADDRVQVAKTLRTASGDEATVAAGRETVCLGVRAEQPAGSSLSCTSADSATNSVDPIVAVSNVEGDTWSVSGLFVDGVRSVTVKSAGGQKTHPVQHNVIAVRTDGAPLTVTWTTSGGTERSLDVSGASRGA